MYRKRNDLNELVKSLSGGEKRYFTSLSKAFTGKDENPIYQQLFTLLVNGESNLQNQFEDYNEKALTGAKKRLYNNILKSLRLFHQEKSANIIIMNLLTEVEILYNLGLSEQALFLLKKAYSLACAYEKFGLVLQILEWEGRLNVVLEIPTRNQSAIVKEESDVMEKQMQYRFLENIYGVAETYKKQHGFAKADLKEEVKSITIGAKHMPLLKDCLSEKARYYFNFIHALYYWMTFDHKSAFEYSKKLLLNDNNPIPPGDYINGILEHITSCVCLGKFEEALGGITIGSAFIEDEKLTQSHAFTVRMFAYKATYRLIIYNYMGKHKPLRTEIKNTEKELKKYEHIISFFSKQIILGNLMNAYMGIGELDKADAVWDSMFNKQAKAVRVDIFSDLYLFRLFSLLHSKTYSLLPSAALSAVRFYRKDEHAQQRFDVELPIAMFLQKERDYSKPKVIREVMEAAKKIVQQFIGTLKGINNFQEHYTRYIIWCDAIINDEPYYEAAARWYNSYTTKQMQLSGTSKKRIK
ncbi:hypothetical protein OKW96_16280 [Sphingobacterium sp. KU25419]|nr:hypothetical protein OKW96_16280 [Sphingobacterium sp. KU25419]